LLDVADNGIGIEARFAERVFVIFQRLHSRESYPGTGIGLALCKKIVEFHGGQIWVDTDHHPGTRICWTLPQSDSDTGAP
jgi:light-regulated signal transduction histidine kinase (bacteriophytochrome)